jgi:hypothetical protein
VRAPVKCYRLWQAAALTDRNVFVHPLDYTVWKSRAPQSSHKQFKVFLLTMLGRAWFQASSGMLRTVQWQFRTDVSGNHIGPIFKSHVVQEGTAWPLKMYLKLVPKRRFGTTNLHCAKSQKKEVFNVRVSCYSKENSHSWNVSMEKAYLISSQTKLQAAIEFPRMPFFPLLFVFFRLGFDRCLTVSTNNFHLVFSEHTRRKNDSSRVLMRLSLQLQTAWHRTWFW